MAPQALCSPPSDRADEGNNRVLVMHVVHRFGVGGLENGIVNLINRLPQDTYRHVIVALTHCDAGFCSRIARDDVEFVSLHKPPGQSWRILVRIWRLFRAYRPSIVHTRNLATLETQLPAWAAGIPVRIHGEHGWDVFDPDGSRRRYQLLRRALDPFVTHYVAVSGDLEQYLTRRAGIWAEKVRLIRNGVDEEKFAPGAARVVTAQAGIQGADRLVVGTVGRLQEIKGQALLIDAVGKLVESDPQRRRHLTVRNVGDGPLRAMLEKAVEERELGCVVEFLGERSDIPDVMRSFDVFVLPSLAEGISNTLLEAMACGLPVVATAVGGNVELVTEGETGTLVAVDPRAIAEAIACYADSPQLRVRHGREARLDVERRFTLSRMVDSYAALYTNALAGCLPLAAQSR